MKRLFFFFCLSWNWNSTVSLSEELGNSLFLFWIVLYFLGRQSILFYRSTPDIILSQSYINNIQYEDSQYQGVDDGGSVGKSTCHQMWQSEFNLQDPFGGPLQRLLISTDTSQHVLNSENNYKDSWNLNQNQICFIINWKWKG